ncbi:MAG: hypothetical protein KF690_02945 [Bacteroidetes bacterium]|nr:hypothetical protein [Bacteroidota bacterium]
MLWVTTLAGLLGIFWALVLLGHVLAVVTRRVFRLPVLCDIHSFGGTWAALLIGMQACVLVVACLYAGPLNYQFPILLVLAGIVAILHRFTPARARIPQQTRDFSWRAFGLEQALPLSLLVILFGTYTLLQVTGDTGSAFPWQPVPLDWHFYAKIIAHLYTNGYETIYAKEALLDPDAYGAQPYHYNELWLAGLLAKVTGLPGVVTLVVHTTTLWLMLAAMGLAGVLAVQAARYWHLALAVALLFCTPVYIPYLFDLGFLSQTSILQGMTVVFPPGVLNSLKLYILLGGWLACWLMYRRYGIAIAYLCALGLLSLFAFAVAAVLFWGILLLIAIWRRKVTAYEILVLTLCTIAVSGWHLAVTLRGHVPAGEWMAREVPLRYVWNLGQQVNITGKTVLQLAALYAVWGVWLWRIWPSVAGRLLPGVSFRAVLGSLLLLAVLGILCWAAVAPVTPKDGIQLLAMGSLVGIQTFLMLAAGLALTTRSTPLWARVFAAVLLAWNIGLWGYGLAKDRRPAYDAGYLARVAQTLSAESRGGYLLPAYTAVPALSHNLHYDFHTLYGGVYMMYIPHHTGAVLMDAQLLLPLAGDVDARQRSQHIFWRYAQQLSSRELRLSEEDIQYRFARHFQLGYLIVPRGGGLPTTLEPHALLLARDRISGDALYRLQW